MSFEELLERFRALGGIAENVALRSGSRGRGIFVLDAGKPATVHVPKTLLVPADAVELRNGALAIVEEAPVASQAREFFETYEREFGWGCGAFEELWRTQRWWSELPKPIVEFLQTMGSLVDPDERFAEPSEARCFKRFVATHQIDVGGRAYFFPVGDLINHCATASPYEIGDGVTVGGTFADEMTVRYNLRDAWSFATQHSFSNRVPRAYSLGITVDVYGRQRLTVRRDVRLRQTVDGIPYPEKTTSGNAVELSYLLLGNSEFTDLPRAIFRKLMAENLAVPQADDTFESILHFNRTKFIALLRLLRMHDTPLTSMLQDAALNQLDTLCDCIGARAI